MTKPKPRSSRPIESFGPEIFQTLVEGAKRKIELQLPYHRAAYFRARANQLRHRMRLEGHPHYSSVSQAKITITWESTTPIRRTARNVRIPLDPAALCTLTIAPYDSEFTEALAAVGINVPHLSPIDDPLTQPQSHVEDILAEFLKK